MYQDQFRAAAIKQNSRALAQAERFLIHFNRKYTVFEAFVLVCHIGMAQIPDNCNELKDTRGPYATELLCKQRIVEITVELPLYMPKYQPKAYRCDELTTPNKEFT